MPAYRAKHHVDHNNVGYDPDEIVRFTDDELATYAQYKTGPVAQLLAAGAIEGERPRVNLPVTEQSIEQLVAIAVALGLPVEEPLDRRLLLASIEAARTRLAAPVPSNTPPLPPVSASVMTAEGPKTTPSEPLDLPALSLDLGLPRLSEIAIAEGVTFATDADAATLLGLIETGRVGRVERRELPALRANLPLARLAEIARDEQVQVADTASRGELIAAIEAKRSAAA